MTTSFPDNCSKVDYNPTWLVDGCKRLTAIPGVDIVCGDPPVTPPPPPNPPPPIAGQCPQFSYGHPDSYRYTWMNPVDPFDPDNGTDLTTTHPDSDCWECDPTCGGRAKLQWYDPELSMWRDATAFPLVYRSAARVRKILGYCEVTDREYMNPQFRTGKGWNVSLILWDGANEVRSDLYYQFKKNPQYYPTSNSLRLRLVLEEEPMTNPVRPAPLDIDGDVPRTPGFVFEPSWDEWTIPAPYGPSDEVPVDASIQPTLITRTRELGEGYYSIYFTTGRVYHRSVPGCNGNPYNVNAYANWNSPFLTFQAYGLKVEILNGAVKQRCAGGTGAQFPANYDAGIKIFTKNAAGVWVQQSINDGFVGLSDQLKWGWDVLGVGGGTSGSVASNTATENSWHHSSVFAVNKNGFIAQDQWLLP